MLDYSAYHAVFRMEREPDADTLWRLTEQSNHEQRSTLILLSALIGLSQAKLRDRAELCALLALGPTPVQQPTGFLRLPWCCLAVFRVYDFDGSGELSHEDLTVMALCLVRGLWRASPHRELTGVVRCSCPDAGVWAYQHAECVQ